MRDVPCYVRETYGEDAILPYLRKECNAKIEDWWAVHEHLTGPSLKATLCAERHKGEKPTLGELVVDVLESQAPAGKVLHGALKAALLAEGNRDANPEFVTAVEQANSPHEFIPKKDAAGDPDHCFVCEKSKEEHKELVVKDGRCVKCGQFTNDFDQCINSGCDESK